MGVSLSCWMGQCCVIGSGLSSLLLEPGKEWGWALSLLLLGTEHRFSEAGGRGAVLLCLGSGERPHTQAFLRQLVSSQGPGSCTSRSQETVHQQEPL